MNLPQVSSVEFIPKPCGVNKKNITLIFWVSKQTLKERALLHQCGNLPESNFKLHSKKTESLRFSGDLGL